MCETTYSVSTRKQALKAVESLMSQAQVPPSTAVRLAAKACFGEIENTSVVGRRLTYNDKRANGFRVKLFVRPNVNLRGRDLYSMYKILSNAIKEYKVAVKYEGPGDNLRVYFSKV